MRCDAFRAVAAQACVVDPIALAPVGRTIEAADVAAQMDSIHPPPPGPRLCQVGAAKAAEQSREKLRVAIKMSVAPSVSVFGSGKEGEAGLPRKVDVPMHRERRQRQNKPRECRFILIGALRQQAAKKRMIQLTISVCKPSISHSCTMSST
jgi:hypothetical protein